jgi:CubicO group peptidase (beta-lactamase class C family)
MRGKLRLLSAVLAATLLGCGEGTIAPSDVGVPPADPARVDSRGFGSFLLGLIEPYLDWHVSSERRSGYVVVVARDGEVKYATAHGHADLASRSPMQIDTRFRIASMTKPVIGVAAMILVERGQLRVDDPVSKYLPVFANPRVARRPLGKGTVETDPLEEELQVEHLLTFRSGIGSAERAEYDTRLDALWSGRSEQIRSTGSLESAAKSFASLPLWERPGQKWRYGRSLEVMGRIIEIAAGEPLDVFLKREVFDPLGMNSTSFMPPKNDRAGLATLYAYDDEGLVVSKDPSFNRQGRVRGSTGLVSTAPDYLRFALMLWNRGSYDGVRILESASVDLMTTAHVPGGVLVDSDIEGLGWGYAIAVVADSDETLFTDRNGDFFWAGAYGSHFFVSPETGIALVVMQQHRFPHRALPDERRGVEVPFVVQALVYAAAD